ncbi:MAG: TetR/AcrR family transcriptional regulator [Arenimonas sp.]
MKKKSAGRAIAPARSYHHGNLRAALVEAGLVALERRERKELSLRGLARQVGVSPNAAYRHFADKEGFLVGMAAEGFRRLAIIGVEARSGRLTPVEAIRAMGYAYIKFARDNPELFRLMFDRVDPMRRTEELKMATRSALKTIYVDMAKALKLKLDDPLVTAGAIHAWSHVHGLSLLILDGQLDHGGTNIDQVIALVANGYRPPKFAKSVD